MATQRSSDAASYLDGPALGIGLLFVLLPLMDIVTQTWPLAPASPTWRYGTVGLGSNYLVSVVFGMGLLCYVAARRNHRTVLLTLTILCAAFAAGALIATLGFVLDVLQIRPTVPRGQAGALRTFDLGAIKALVKYLASAFVLAWLAVAELRARRAMPRAAKDETPRLVQKQQSS